MSVADRVELAHEPDFVLGRLTVSPSRRELVRDDGEREVIEHRMMRVLIALTKARGNILTRDELIMSCWDGVVVGDDAINRVMSRLRKVASGIGAGSIEIETITKVGYRLTSNGDRGAVNYGLIAHDETTGQAGPPTSRRGLVLTAMGVGAIVAAGGGAFLYRRVHHPPLPREVGQLLAQAKPLRDQNTFEGLDQAIGLYRRAVELAPDYADGWAMLGLTYAIRSHYGMRGDGASLRARADAAARRSLELDPGNGGGELALAMALPFVGPWMERARLFQRALADRPHDDDVLAYRAMMLQFVGRSREAVSVFEKIGHKPLTPVFYASYIQALWSCGRVEAADQAIDDAAELYPAQGLIWFLRLGMLTWGGRPAEAISFAQNASKRPSDVSDAQVAELLSIANALQSRNPAQVDAVVDRDVKRAPQAGPYAVGAIRHASALGRLDEAFAVANAYFFGRGFAVRDFPTPESGVSLDQRRTDFLFQPVTQAMRADPRFGPLVEELGLERFWRESGIQPDYRLMAGA
jgi:DNA-binding winged helix-turn-helix (wHTH) protein/tetratricopeptide (TPR) repeat protein